MKPNFFKYTYTNYTVFKNVVLHGLYPSILFGLK